MRIRSLFLASLMLMLAAGGLIFRDVVPARAVRPDAGDPFAAPAPSAAYLPPILTDLPGTKAAKLSARLGRLHATDTLERSRGHAAVNALNRAGLPDDVRGAIEARQLRIDVAGNVQVYVETEDASDATIASLTALGFAVERVNDDAHIVQGTLPIASLPDASAVPGVRLVREPDYGFTSAGIATSQGDAILDADKLRATYGATGSGVRVGVISDGLEGLAASQASGDLPAVNSSACDMIASAPPGQPANPTDAGAGAEGTAMLEIVHDLAPGAELWLGYWGFNANGTALDFMAAVHCLAQNVDIVIDDIGFFNAGPYDGTSLISQNASIQYNDNANRIRGYYNAVANEAAGHYQEDFLGSGSTISDPPTGRVWQVHRFQATAATTDGGLGLLCSANPAQGFCGDKAYLQPGGFLAVSLEWNEPFGASGSDYDLFLLNENTGQLLSAPSNVQDGNDAPVESFGWFNSTGGTQTLDIVVGRRTGVTKNLDIFVHCQGCNAIAGKAHNFNTARSSVPNNSDAGGGVVSMGAISATDPGNDTIEYFSSQGPTEDNRIKPDAAAIDGVSVTGNGGFPSTFYGTSATGPHAGAIAALILSCKPILKAFEPGDSPFGDRFNLRNAILNTAHDLGAGGTDNVFGTGRIDADAAAAAAGCVPVTTDTDADGCTDVEENGPNHVLGGDRDPNNQYDFFDTPVPALLPTQTTGTKDKTASLADVLAVLRYVGTVNNGPPNSDGADYDTDLNVNGVNDGVEYDRAPSSNVAKPWRSGAPNGSVTLQDALVALAQVGDSCAAPP